MGRFGVFKRSANGSWWWMSAADDLAEAKRAMLDFARKTGHEYFVHDFLLEKCVDKSIDNKPTGISTPQRGKAEADSSSQPA